MWDDVTSENRSPGLRTQSAKMTKTAGEEPKVVLGHGRERVDDEGSDTRTVTAVWKQVLPDEVDEQREPRRDCIHSVVPHE